MNPNAVATIVEAFKRAIRDALNRPDPPKRDTGCGC